MSKSEEQKRKDLIAMLARMYEALPEEAQIVVSRIARQELRALSDSSGR